MDDIGKEVVFGLDNFQQQKVLDEQETIAQMLLNVFFLKPGNYPSMPHIGINIREYLYKSENEIDPDELKEKIYNQSSALIPHIILGEVKIFIADYKGESILMIQVPIMKGSTTSTVVYGFKKDSSGNILFNYKFETDTMKEI